MTPEQPEALPEGAVLSIDSSIADPPPTIDAPEEKAPTPGAFMTPEKFLGILRKMVATEQMTLEQARQMRKQMGITQSYFTGTKITDEERRERRHRVKASRRINRHNGSGKGQKRNHGRGD